MLASVDVIPNNGTTLTLTLADPSNGFETRNIDGLDPVKATLVSSSFANFDGQQYHNSRREARNIIFTIGLVQDFITTSAQSLRRQLYGFFMPKSQVKLRFRMADGTYFDIDGRVESFDSTLFSKEPSVTISVMCFDPDFYQPVPVTFNGLTTSTTDETLFSYDGTVDTGLSFTLDVDRDLFDFTIFHRAPDGTITTMEITLALANLDVVDIVTVPGSKAVTLTRAGETTFALWGLTPVSGWIQLQPGDNYIRVFAEGAPIPFSIEYIAKYGGL